MIGLNQNCKFILTNNDIELVINSYANHNTTRLCNFFCTGKTHHYREKQLNSFLEKVDFPLTRRKDHLQKCKSFKFILSKKEKWNLKFETLSFSIKFCLDSFLDKNKSNEKNVIFNFLTVYTINNLV